MLVQEIRRYFNPTLNERIDVAVLEVVDAKMAEEAGLPHLIFGVYTRYKTTGEILVFPDVQELGEVADLLTATFGAELDWNKVLEDAPTGPLPDPLAPIGAAEETLDEVELPDTSAVELPRANRSLLDEAEAHFKKED